MRRLTIILRIIAKWDHVTDTPVRLFRIIPDQVFHEVEVKGIQFLQLIDMPVSELILQRLVEAFYIGIGLRIAGIVKEMDQITILAATVEMAAKVIDASVIAAWCFREPRASEALAIVRETELHAPLLLAYEMTSIARKKAIAYPEKAGLIEEALRTALALPIHWSEVNHLAVMRLELDTNLTTYDACYLYVAGKAGISLATFDESLEKASRRM